MKSFDIKVVGFEAIYAENEEDALNRFDAMLRGGYTVGNLRWKSVCVFDTEVGGETGEEELLRLIREAKKHD